MSEFLEILKYTIPAIIVLILAYLMMRQFVKIEKNRMGKEIHEASQKIIAPIRIKAYERVVLFLERILPGNIIMRVSRPGMTADQLQAFLIKTVREEYEHNMSQQLYLSSSAWELVKNAKEGMIKVINSAYAQAGEKSSASEFSQIIFNIYLEQEKSFIDIALKYVKEELEKRI